MYTITFMKPEHDFDSAANTTAIIKMYDDYFVLTASVGSELLQFFDKLEKVVCKQLGLLKSSKVTTLRHKSVGVDVMIPNLCPRLRAVHQLSWEGSESSGHKYPCPKIKDGT